MSDVIDRRLNGKNKSSANRERFLKRYKDKIKKSVTESLTGRSITDIDKGGDVSVQRKDIEEPYFGHSDGGDNDIVIPGNDSYSKGDQFKRPKKGKGQGGPGDGDPFDDEFAFTLTKEEFLHYFFEGMELPDLVKKKLAESDSTKTKRAGYTTQGCSSNLHVIRSLRSALGRRIALGADAKKKLEELLAALDDSPERHDEIELEIAKLRRTINAITFIDPIDLRYRNSVVIPAPATKAVMFCIMDVSGSMGEYEKDIAKRFFILLYLFLHKTYKQIDLVFIRHTTIAQEVSEHDFFYGKESGGTLVSPALVLMDKIIQERYSTADWNVYGAQLSDGDNSHYDSPTCGELLANKILPACQYYAYVEVGPNEGQSLWKVYQLLLEDFPNFSVKAVIDPSHIYPVFAELFKKKVGAS